MEILASIFAIVLVLLFWVIIPVNMATKRGRSGFGWFVFTLIITPIWTIIILAILGDSKKKIKDDILKELGRR